MGQQESCPPTPPPHVPGQSPSSPFQAGRAGGSRRAGGQGSPSLLAGHRAIGGPARCMSVAVAFVRGLSIRVCPSVRVSISQEIKLCTPSLAAWGRGLGGAGGAASHHRICMLMGPSPPNINFLFLWFGTNGAGPAQLPPPTWPCGGAGSGPWALTLASPPWACPTPPSLCLSPHLPRLRARWCHWRGCGCPPPCRGLGSRGGPRAPSWGARQAAGGGPGWAPRPGVGCQARRARGARGSS